MPEDLSEQTTFYPPESGGGVASSCPDADLGTTHLALLGELAGIAEQVEQNLLQPHGSPRSRSAKIV
jgi:hypothetical protein